MHDTNGPHLTSHVYMLLLMMFPVCNAVAYVDEGVVGCNGHEGDAVNGVGPGCVHREVAGGRSGTRPRCGEFEVGCKSLGPTNPMLLHQAYSVRPFGELLSRAHQHKSKYIE